MNKHILGTEAHGEGSRLIHLHRWCGDRHLLQSTKDRFLAQAQPPARKH